MTINEIIDGLQFTIDMILFDPMTGQKMVAPRNDMDAITFNACTEAIEILKEVSAWPKD